jgi:hypothetical protein
MTDPSGNGWAEYRKFVVSALEVNKKQLHGIETRLRSMEQDIVMLKTKVYISSALIGLTVSGIISLLVGLAS